MTLPCDYSRSGAFLQSGIDSRTLDFAEEVLGPDIEFYGRGQVLYKEPCGGHPKMLHQDAAYFEHKFEGPLAMLNYAVDTDVERGALHIIPGSHKYGIIKHGDTFSHLGLDSDEWTLDKALAIEGQAGDSIFFHVNTIHGSPPNNSDQARPVFIHRYRSVNDYVSAGGITAGNRGKRTADQDDQGGLVVRGFLAG